VENQKKKRLGGGNKKGEGNGTRGIAPNDLNSVIWSAHEGVTAPLPSWGTRKKYESKAVPDKQISWEKGKISNGGAHMIKSRGERPKDPPRFQTSRVRQQLS